MVKQLGASLVLYVLNLKRRIDRPLFFVYITADTQRNNGYGKADIRGMRSRRHTDLDFNANHKKATS